jgi:hypothetical protein
MRRKITIIVLAIVGLSLLVSAMALSGLKQQKQALTELERAAQNGVPVESFPMTDLSTQRSMALASKSDTNRQARNKRFNITGLPQNQVARFALPKYDNPNSNSVSLGSPPPHSPVEPALPISQSDLIIIGKVTDAQAYISEDETSIYSEFTIGIEHTLKARASLNIPSATQVIATRYGGRLRLPSGKVLLHGLSGKTMPLAGRRYVLFLKFNKEGEDFTIVTGYELTAGKVAPLDGNTRLKEGKYRQYKEYDQFYGVDEQSFLNQVQIAIVNDP